MADYPKETIKAVLLKVSPRGEYAKNIQDTHRIVQDMVRAYSELLLDMFQENVHQDNQIVPGSVFKDRLVHRLVNNGVLSQNIEPACQMLRKYVDQILAGAAKNARGLQDPLVSKGSQAGEAPRFRSKAFAGLLPPPETTFKDFLAENPSWPEVAKERFLASPETHSSQGRPPAFNVCASKKKPCPACETLSTTYPKVKCIFNDPSWAEKLFKSLQKDLENQVSEMLPELQEMKALPIMIPAQIEDAKGLSSFERMAFAQAVEHFLSWSSWNAKCQEDVAAVERDVQNLTVEINPETLSLVRAFEDSRGYRLNYKALRGWDEIDFKPSWDANRRLECLNARQQKHPKKFGDFQALVWLAQNTNIHEEDGDIDNIFKLNAAIDKLERIKRYANFTPASLKSPRFARFDTVANTNSPQYDLAIQPDGSLQAKIETLLQTGDSISQEKVFLRLHHSKQIQNLSLKTESKIPKLNFSSQDKLSLDSFDLGGASLVVRKKQTFLKLTLKKENPKINLDLLKYMNSGLEKRQQMSPPQQDVVRIAAYDFGMRIGATLCVLNFFTKTQTWKIERTVPLRLPGEKTSTKIKKGRKTLLDKLYALKDRIRDLNNLAKAIRSQDLNLLATVKVASEATRHYKILAQDIDKDLKTWKKSPRGVLGKSDFAIDFLTKLRRTLVSWYFRTKPWTDQSPPNKDVVPYQRLLTHINTLKKDRNDTLANIITQAARGCVYENNAWVKRFEPVDILAEEDLDQFRPHIDRTPSDNDRLARMRQKTLSETLQRSLAEYGIPLAQYTAAFTSQFNARSALPGARCLHISKEHIERLQNPKFWLHNTLEHYKINPASLKAGDLIPAPGGTLFVSNGKGKHIVHADVNAAENGAILYATAYKQPLFLNARAIKDKDSFLGSLGARIGGALGGPYALLSPKPFSQTKYNITVFKSAKEAQKFSASILKIKPPRQDDKLNSTSTNQETSRPAPPLKSFGNKQKIRSSNLHQVEYRYIGVASLGSRTPL